MRSALGIALSSALVLAAFSSRPAETDDIILDDDSVIEGIVKEIDQKAGILRLQIDEKGTVKVYRLKNVKAIFKRETTWQRRARYEADFEKKKKLYKETWDSQFRLAKWCKSHMLGDKAGGIFKHAYDLRIAQLKEWMTEGKFAEGSKEELDWRVKIAKWADSECGLPDEARKEYEYAFKIKKGMIGGEATADAHYQLGRWAKDADLTDLALAEFEKAVEIDAAHKGALAAVAEIKESLEYKAKELVALYAKDNRAWKVSVAIEENVGKEFIEDWQKRMQDISDYFFNLTEGQFFITECEIEDNTSEGKIIVEKGKNDWYGLNNQQGTGVLAYCKASGTPMWEVHSPGKAGVSVLAHEMGHGIFGLPDEYYQNPQCDCMMRAAPNPQRLCNKDTHIGGGRRPGPPGSEGKDCWQIVLGRKEFNASVKAPNPDWSWADEPTKQQPAKTGNRTDGLRNPGGELNFKGLKLKEPPRIAFRVTDN